VAQTVKVGVHVDVDVRGALRALRGISKDASKELRRASVEIVDREVPRIHAAAALHGRQARAAARSVRARSDRVPAIAVGGRKRVTSSRNGYAGSIFFGSDAGSVQYKQFPSPNKSYWFWDQLGRDSTGMMRAWGKAYDKVVSQWGRQGSPAEGSGGH